MILQYIDAAMRKATYELLPDDGLCYSEIPGFDGVYATAKQLEVCREEVKATLEDWLLLGISKNLPTPIIDDISLEIKNIACSTTLVHE